MPDATQYEIRIKVVINSKFGLSELRKLLLSDKQNLEGCLNLSRENLKRYLDRLIVGKERRELLERYVAEVIDDDAPFVQVLDDPKLELIEAK